MNENVLKTFLATVTASNVNLKCFLQKRPYQWWLKWLKQGLWNEPAWVQIPPGPSCVASGQLHCLSVPWLPRLETGDPRRTHSVVMEPGEWIHTEYAQKRALCSLSPQ